MKNELAIIRDGAIIWFYGKYRFLSNFYNCHINYRGRTYQNAEAAFQAQKVDVLSAFRPNQFSEKDKEVFTNTKDANYIKLLGMGRVKEHPEYRMNQEELSVWNRNALSIMEEIVRAKFEQNQDLKEKLLETESLNLIEGNNWGDDYYGITLVSEYDNPKNAWERKTLKRGENGEKLYILSQPENEYNNQLGKILVKIRKELSE